MTYLKVSSIEALRIKWRIEVFKNLLASDAESKTARVLIAASNAHPDIHDGRVAYPRRKLFTCLA